MKVVFCFLYFLYNIECVIKVNCNKVLVFFIDFFDVIFIIGLLEFLLKIVNEESFLILRNIENKFIDYYIFSFEDIGI